MGTLTDKYRKLYDNVMSFATYCWSGVWRDSSKSIKVRVIKILNLSARTFMDSDLQTQAAALTYRTLLAIVPAFALLFAIGRGFNLQDLLQSPRSIRPWRPPCLLSIPIWLRLPRECLSA